MTSQSNLYFELTLRFALYLIFSYIEVREPSIRKIHPEEVWRYKYPQMKSIFPSTYLWFVVYVLPLTVIFISNKIQKNNDTRETLLSFTLAMQLTGIVTGFLKTFVGKPRPDFYWRCFPYGFGNQDMICKGNPKIVREGRKSFPSGHAAYAFASMGYLTLYLISKLHVFNSKGRNETWRPLVCSLPCFIATYIAITRICDYHHDEIDIIAGMLIGIFFAYICYRQYYPNLSNPNCHLPYADEDNKND